MSPAVRRTAAPGVAGRPLQADEGTGGASRVGGRRLPPPPQLPPIEEGFVVHGGRQIVTPHTGLRQCLSAFLLTVLSSISPEIIMLHCKA